MASDDTPSSPIDIGFDEGFERRWWTVQRVSWCCIYAIMLAALLGALGDGPLARIRRTTPAGVLEVDRILHTGTPTSMRVTTASAGAHTVTLSETCLPRGALQRITPDPATSTISPRELRYSFASGVDALRAEITVRYPAPGIHRCTVSVDDAPVATFTRVVLP